VTPGFLGSPWPDEHPRTRPVTVLSEDQDADVVIVGGGISGLATAQQLVAGTDLRVTLIDAGLVGHGATGNNGGQAVEGSETGFSETVSMAGQERALQGFRELVSARGELEGTLREIGSPSMLTEAVGRLGIADQGMIERWTGDLDARRKAGMDVGKVRVAEDAPLGLLKDAPRTPRAMLARQMWSKDRRYIACFELKVGLINTFDLVETLAGHLLSSFPERLSIFERSPVELMRFSEEDVTLSCNGHLVLADSVVLCTNGYTAPRIEACSPALIRGSVQGVVGYMVGCEGGNGHEGARAYFPGGENYYYYLARRRYRGGWLTASGGPEGPITRPYDPGIVYHPGAFERLEAFLSTTLDGYVGPSGRRWQGLMGYTPTGSRIAGQDPMLPSLYYNMGCNGIGILSAVAGAKRLAGKMKDEDLEPSMFDPEVLSEVIRLKDRGRDWERHP
jgi:glycine/D-amino acid oxidase-like deaminating enzyme